MALREVLQMVQNFGFKLPYGQWKGKPEQNMCADVATIGAFDQDELINITNMSFHNSNKKQGKSLLLAFLEIYHK